jgi:hypothetical protein
MDLVTSFQGEQEFAYRTREYLREAHQSELARIANADTPNLWQRISDRLPRIQISVRVTLKNPMETLAYPTHEANTRGAATWTR